MKFKVTPGPWQIPEGTDEVHADGRLIATLAPGTSLDDRRLLESAPMLLATLEIMESALKKHGGVSATESYALYRIAQDMLKKARP